jgi:hypothetical protein
MYNPNTWEAEAKGLRIPRQPFRPVILAIQEAEIRRIMALGK